MVHEDKPITMRRIGNISSDKYSTGLSGNVWDKKGICQTLLTMQGGNKQPFIIAEETVEYIIVAMRGRNPDNPSDRTPGIPTEQRLEPNSQGLCNTLTTVQKDNLVLEVRE